jgi:hypothetical protein
MVTRCGICKHPERAAIEQEITSGDLTYKAIGARHGIGYAVVYRHKRDHMNDHAGEVGREFPPDPELTPAAHLGTPEPAGSGQEYPSTPEGHQETPKAYPSTPDEVEVLSVDQGTPEAHQSTPDESELSEVHPSTPAHQGALEEYQEVIDEVHQSVPDAPHIGTEQTPSEPPSTPIVHPEVSPDDSTPAHSGVPARQEHGISTPMVHPGTPTEEDWMLWTAMKGRWAEIETMLADWQSRHSLLSTPSGTPRHTMKKTYVVDRLYIELIERYAQERGVERKDVVNAAFQRFFEQVGYL